MIESRVIRMPGGKLFSILLWHFGIFWIVAAFAGVVIFLVLGFAINYRFFFLTLIWIFLLVPLVMAFLYFFYAMEPLTVFNSIPHKIIFSDNEVILRMENTDQENGENENLESSQKEYIAKKDDFKYAKTGPDYLILFFNKIGWLWIPVNAFDSIDDFKNISLKFLKNDKP